MKKVLLFMVFSLMSFSSYTMSLNYDYRAICKSDVMVWKIVENDLYLSYRDVYTSVDEYDTYFYSRCFQRWRQRKIPYSNLGEYFYLGEKKDKSFYKYNYVEYLPIWVVF